MGLTMVYYVFFRDDHGILMGKYWDIHGNALW